MLARPLPLPLLLWSALFIYGSVIPCVSWEITSSKAGGNWQDVSKEIFLSLSFRSFREQRMGSLEQEAMIPQVGLETKQSASVQTLSPPSPPTSGWF